MSENLWFVCCAQKERADLAVAVRMLEQNARLVYFSDASELRASLYEEEPRVVAVAIGTFCEGVSSYNLAAAITHDGLARRVVLVGRNITGSQRVRARQAGVSCVIDLSIDIAGVGGVEQIQAPCVGGRPDMLPAPAGKETQEKKSTIEEANLKPQGTPLEPRPASLSVSARMIPTLESVPVAAATHADANHADNGAPVLVVASGRGGVGKTSIVAVAAYIAASWGMRVSLVDLDLGCGNLYSCLGFPRPAALDACLANNIFDDVKKVVTGKPNFATLPSLDELLSIGIKASEDITLWGPCARPEMAEHVSPLVKPLVDALACKYDLVLVDTSNTCTDAVAQAFQRCTRLLLVHNEVSGGIGSMAHTSALAVRLGVARTRIVRIANHGDRRVKFDLNAGRAEVGLETARAYRVLEGGAEVGELVAAGHAAELASVDSPFTKSLAKVLAQILEELGRLPESDAVAQVLGKSQKGVRHRLFQKRKAS